MSSYSLPDPDPLREHLQTSNNQRREEIRQYERQNSLQYDIDVAVSAFDDAVGNAAKDSANARWNNRIFNPEVHIPAIAALVSKALAALQRAGRLGVLDDIDLDAAFKQLRSSFHSYRDGHVRTALDFAVKRLRGATTGNQTGFEQLVRELFFDDAVQPAGTWFQLLLAMLQGRLGYQSKTGPGHDENAGDARRQAGPEKGEEGKPKRTKKRLEESKPMKANVYKCIIAEHKSGKKPAAILTILKNDKGFKELLQSVDGMKLDRRLIKAALAWGNDPKRKNQEPPPV